MFVFFILSQSLFFYNFLKDLKKRDLERKRRVRLTWNEVVAQKKNLGSWLTICPWCGLGSNYTCVMLFVITCLVSCLYFMIC